MFISINLILSRDCFFLCPSGYFRSFSSPSYAVTLCRVSGMDEYMHARMGACMDGLVFVGVMGGWMY